MRYLQELSYEQIAEKMRCEIELTRVVVHRATKSFARIMKEAGISETALGRWLKTWITSANEHKVDALAEVRDAALTQPGEPKHSLVPPFRVYLKTLDALRQ